MEKIITLLIRQEWKTGGLLHLFPVLMKLPAMVPEGAEVNRIALVYNRNIPMKAFVTVMLKTTVLDPQGKTIQGALRKMGYKGVDAVRQGKFFEIALDGGLDKAAAKAEVERIAKEVLTNPVIEEFSYRIEG